VDDRERVQLLFGPYTAPSLKRGDRTQGLSRDALIGVTGWSNGPIPVCHRRLQGA
jgi:hypothetical protein